MNSRCCSICTGGNKNVKKFEITEIKYSPLGDLIAIGCKDNCIHLLSIAKGYRKVAVCRGHTSPIKQVDFSADGKILKSNDILSKELLFWEVDTGSRISNHLVYRDIPWHSMSCIYGWSLQGIFNRYNSVQEKFLPVENDVNCISKCPNANIMAVSSSFTGHSSIKLFSYPVVPDAIPKYYGGHTSPVVDLAFVSMYQGSQLYLFSAGGNDSCIFIWDVHV
jgi:WD40 repeat protein